MSYRNTITFTESLIKGKVAEIIFQRMFIEMGTALVIPFGYESIAPVLAQSIKEMDDRDKQDLRNVRNMPDFLLVAKDRNHARLVDVKYRERFVPSVVSEIASEIYQRWPSAWVFLATQEGFFFGECAQVRKNGLIEPLQTALVSKEKQAEYLGLLRKYIR